MKRIDEPQRGVESRCECGGRFTVLPDSYAIAHSMPPCATFLAMDALAYVQRQRRRIQAICERPVH